MATSRLPHLLWGPPDGGPRRPRVLLGCSGSVATIKVPALVQQLERRGAHVIVVPTRSALHFLRTAAEAQPPATVATAGAGDSEVGCARSDLPSALAGVAHHDVTGRIEREGKGVSEDCDTDTSIDFECAVKCKDEERILGLEKVSEVNRDQESEGRGRIKVNCCDSKENSCAVQEGIDFTLSHCCSNACDRCPGLPLARCSCESVHRSCKGEVGFGKLCGTNTVQTQTEIAGLNCCVIQDSCDKIFNNSTDESNFKISNRSTSDIKNSSRVPSHCLSCLKVLETAALGSFKTRSSNDIPAEISYEKKPPTLAWPQPAAEGLTSPDSGIGRDSQPQSCVWCATQRLLPGLVIAGDALEWEGWRGRGDPVLHIDLRRWADLGVIAPLSANTLAKLANGLCDNLLTCVARAWDSNKPLLFCPAMNTHMYKHPLTRRQITSLVELGYVEVPAVCKRLVCGDVGGGAMAEVETIVEAVWGALQRHIGPNAPLPPSSILSSE